MASRSFIASLILISYLVLCPSRASAESANVELAAPLPAVSPALGASQALHVSRKARSNSISLVRQGCELDRQGKHLQALQKFEQASQIDPSYETALSNLVTACLVNGRLNQGLSAGMLFHCVRRVTRTCRSS